MTARHVDRIVVTGGAGFIGLAEFRVLDIRDGDAVRLAIQPTSAYGLSTLTVEHDARRCRHAKGLDVRTLRYGNVYGPRPDHLSARKSA